MRAIARVDEGVHLHWAELGEGRPLVLLHGISDSHRTWARVAPALARSRRVIMLDLPGHGLSDRPDASYSLDWYARIVGSWLDVLELDDIDLVGHSFGGGVAQWLLLKHRERIRRLALVAPGGMGLEVGLPLRLCSMSRVVERFGQPFMSSGTRVAMRTLRGVFECDDVDELSWMNAAPGSARALSRTVGDVIDWRGQRRHFFDRAHEVGDLPPMALVWGERDPVVPISHVLEATELLEGVVVTRLAGCGHFPHRECPESFIRAVETFVDAEAWPAVRIRRPANGARRRARPGLLRRAWATMVATVRRVFPRRAKPNQPLRRAALANTAES